MERGHWKNFCMLEMCISRTFNQPLRLLPSLGYLALYFFLPPTATLFYSGLEVDAHLFVLFASVMFCDDIEASVIELVLSFVSQSRYAVECYVFLLIPVICSHPQFVLLHFHSCCHISLCFKQCLLPVCYQCDISICTCLLIQPSSNCREM